MTIQQLPSQAIFSIFAERRRTVFSLRNPAILSRSRTLTGRQSKKALADFKDHLVFKPSTLVFYMTNCFACYLTFFTYNISSQFYTEVL